MKIGFPSNLKEEVKQILPFQKYFKKSSRKKIIPEKRRKTFSDSWRGVFGTTKYNEKDKERVIAQLEKLV